MRTLCRRVGHSRALWGRHQRGKMLPSTFSSRMVSTRLRCGGGGAGAGCAGRRAGPRPSPALPGLAVTSRRSRGSGIRVGFSCGGRNSSSLRAARADFCRRIRSEISSACGCRGQGAGMLRSLGDGRPRLALRTPGRVVPPPLPRPGPAPASPAGGRSAVGERGLGRGPRRP